MALDSSSVGAQNPQMDVLSEESEYEYEYDEAETEVRYPTESSSF